MPSKKSVKKPKIDPFYKNFKGTKWKNGIDVRDFIQNNYKTYDGDESFLEGPTKMTQKLWKKTKKLLKKEFKKGGIFDIDTKTVSTITSHEAGYIDEKNESIFGLQTDEALKRSLKPGGGIRLAEASLKQLGYKPDPMIHEIYSNYVTTHNDAVFDIYKHWDDFYTPAGKFFRSEGIITGLPDNYSRGRIIGDYRRIALYGVDKLIEERKADEKKLCGYMNEENIERRVFFHKQLKALKDIKQMAQEYDFDVSVPASDVKEAIQWLYFGYLAAVKEQDGAAMSLGRVDAFIDIFAERDLQAGKYSEAEVQQFIDDFVVKLRVVRHLRHPEYDALFAGDPTWVTCALGGMSEKKKHMVTKTSFRLLHTLENLGPAPEPNLTVLWAAGLPKGFKNYSTKIAIESSSLQFENDDLMRGYHGDDYAIACCVSAMTVGKQMQFFGARCNLPKLLLMCINEGKNELSGDLVMEGVGPLKHRKVLDYKEVSQRFYKMMDWLAKKYVETMNVIHYSHDRHHYENSQMALHDAEIERFMAFGIAGMSIVADSLSAIKYAKVSPVYNKKGIAKGFKIKGDYPAFGNDDKRVDDIAVDVCKRFITALRKYPTYKNAKHSLSLLTITANVVYGKHTGATPDGRKAFEPFAPGANPMHNRDKCGALASLNSMAKLPYKYCRDGISNTFSITPSTLGKDEAIRVANLVDMLDGYFKKGGHHINVNVLDREVLEEAMKKPWKYPQLTIRVSGYAVNFIKLTREQQEEVISRTFHKKFY
ncbi:formate C-acetyltransferase [Patescibacteria group bacterium]|nr:formate C-acetyltransferase [Patescibacteria group bacterium]